MHHDIDWCREEGLQFTAYNVGLLAYGEENEKRKKFQSYPSFPVLDKTIGTILDGCKNCKAEVPGAPLSFFEGGAFCTYVQLY